MSPASLRLGAGWLLGIGLVALPALADDKPKPPDWSGYTYVTDVVGEVVRADDSRVTLRITWFEPNQKGAKTTRPRLSTNPRNFNNPYHPNMNRPNQQRVTFKEVHHDYDLDYLPQSLVRVKTLPPKYDEKGKKLEYTQKEFDEIRAPTNVTGYAANRTDLTPGTIVEVILVRDKTIPAAKATEDDLRIKYAIIQGRDPNPPKDIANPKTDTKKKEKKN